MEIWQNPGKVYSHSKSKLESGMKTPAINQQRYHKIQHLEPEIRHMVYHPERVRQMNFELYDVL